MAAGSLPCQCPIKNAAATTVIASIVSEVTSSFSIFARSRRGEAPLLHESWRRVLPPAGGLAFTAAVGGNAAGLWTGR